MIQLYELKFNDLKTVDDSVLYERYVDQIGAILTDTGLFTNVQIVKPDDPSSVTGNLYEAYKVQGCVNGKTVVTFDLAAAAVSGTTYKYLNGQRISAHYNSDDSEENACRAIQSGSTSASNIQYGLLKAYVTTNGIMFQTLVYSYNTYRGWSSILIAKSNKDYPIVVFPFPDNANSRGSIESCHRYGIVTAMYDDPSYFYTLSAGQNPQLCDLYDYMSTAKQTEMFPFAAYGSEGNFSFSKYALWLPFAPSSIRNGGFQKVLVNGKTYVTDGYFALRDE